MPTKRKGGLPNERSAWKKKKTRAPGQDERIIADLKLIPGFFSIPIDYEDQTLEPWRIAFEAGNLGIVVEALGLCRKNRWTLPEWLHLAVVRLAQGRGGDIKKWWKGHQKDTVDFDRYCAVLACRQRGVKYPDVYERAAELFAGHNFQLTENMIRDSYRRCRQRIKENPYRYFQLRQMKLKPWLDSPAFSK